MNFIEEIYYGNINPQARSSDQNPKVQKDMQSLSESEDFLTDKLSGEEKRRFISYVDAWATVNGESKPRQLHHRLSLGCPVCI